VLEQGGERKVAPDGYVWFVPKSGNPMLVGKEFSDGAKGAISQIAAARDFAAISENEAWQKGPTTVTYVDDAGKKVTTVGKAKGFGTPAPGEDYAGTLCALVETSDGAVHAIPRDRLLSAVPRKGGVVGVAQAIRQTARRALAAVKGQTRAPGPGVAALIDKTFAGADRALAARAVAAFSDEDLAALEKYSAALSDREKALSGSADAASSRKAIEKSRKDTEDFLKNWVRCRGL
jgi:hypothetical protein